MPRRYVTLDVFTARPFGGNPLAVVLDAAGLSDAAMQQITREFNLSETVFVLPPKDSSHRARLRIFTLAHELPFAGHPTVGAAVLLALRRPRRALVVPQLAEPRIAPQRSHARQPIVICRDLEALGCRRRRCRLRDRGRDAVRHDQQCAERDTSDESPDEQGHGDRG